MDARYKPRYPETVPSKHPMTENALALLRNFRLAHQVAENTGDHTDLYRMMDEVAADHLLTPSELGWLADQSSTPAKNAVAQNDRALPATILNLSHSGSATVRCFALMNPNLPSQRLHTVWEEELAWAGQNTHRLNTDRILTEFPEFRRDPQWLHAEDRTFYRFGLAENPNSTSRHLNELARIEKDERVLLSIALRHTAPASALMAVLVMSADLPAVRRAIATNPAADTATMMWLADDTDREVLWGVSLHPNTPQVAKDALTAHLNSE